QAASRAFHASVLRIQSVYRTSRYLLRMAASRRSRRRTGFSAARRWCDVSADGNTRRTIHISNPNFGPDFLKRAAPSIETFALQREGGAARELHDVDDLHHFAVIQRAGRFQEDSLEVFGPPVERAIQLRLQFAERGRRLRVQRVTASGVDRHDERGRIDVFTR